MIDRGVNAADRWAAVFVGTGLNACTLLVDRVVAATNPSVDQMAVLVNFIVVSVSCVCLSKKRSYEVLFLLSVRTEDLSSDSPNLAPSCIYRTFFPGKERRFWIWNRMVRLNYPQKSALIGLTLTDWSVCLYDVLYVNDSWNGEKNRTKFISTIHMYRVLGYSPNTIEKTINFKRLFVNPSCIL